jgi:IS1 family transposase
MNRLDNTRRAQVLRCLVEGTSLRSTSRITGVAINTVVKLGIDAGKACADCQDKVMRNLKCERLQADEIWSFVYAKQKNVTPEISSARFAGDVWTWTAIDTDTKLVPCWMLGGRHAAAARDFIEDLAGRLSSRIQLTTDGLKVYVQAVKDAFGSDIDYAQLIKVYGIGPQGEKRYSPAICTSCESKPLIGRPDPEHINTSYVERQNLSMRMGMRRFTRLTNGLSKKIENHAATVALYFMHYNFVRIHKTLRCTPAMAAGVDARLWEIKDLVEMIEAYENSN